jgi:hypothetical protein
MFVLPTVSAPLDITDLYDLAMVGQLTARLWLSRDPSAIKQDVFYHLKTLWLAGVLDLSNPDGQLEDMDKPYQLSRPFRGLPPEGVPRGIAATEVGEAALHGKLSLSFWNSLPHVMRHPQAARILRGLTSIGVLVVVEIRGKIPQLRLAELLAEHFVPAPPRMPADAAPIPRSSAQATSPWSMPDKLTLVAPSGQVYRAGMEFLLGPTRFQVMEVSMNAEPMVKLSTLDGKVKIEFSGEEILSELALPIAGAKTPVGKKISRELEIGA